MKTMTKQHNLLDVDKAGPVFTIDADNSQGWRQTAPGAGTFISSAYFDLAGLSMNDKTLFFEGAAVQEVQNPAAVANGAAGDLIQVADIMTTVPLTDTEALGFMAFGNMSGPFATFDQCIYARLRVYSIDVDFAASTYFNLLSSNQMGSLSPTASDRVYCYRVVVMGTNNASTRMYVYPARYLLRAEAKEEPEYEYLMRLKRSYELQNEPDVD